MSTYADTVLLGLQTRAASLLKNRYPKTDAYSLTADHCREVIAALEPKPESPPSILAAFGVDTMFASVFARPQA